jgi:hypothetical protein
MPKGGSGAVNGGHRHPSQPSSRCRALWGTGPSGPPPVKIQLECIFPDQRPTATRMRGLLLSRYSRGIVGRCPMSPDVALSCTASGQTWPGVARDLPLESALPVWLPKIDGGWPRPMRCGGSPQGR